MEYNPKDITHGLIVVDPTQKGENLDILHFVGYWSEPTKDDANHLREELRQDKEFGLTEIADRIEILPAPKDIVEHFKKMIK